MSISAARLPALPAFPGAEGAGANATGGRGGSVYYVTNLNDTGPGSLRTGISSASGPRTILFKVSGTIELQTDLSINKPNLTIAGQTAPGDGITLKRRTVKVSNRDVIVRFIRCRPGDADSAFEGDALWVVNATNVMIDHVSTSWSVDECLSVTWSTNVTVQWCMISESLKNSQHDKGAHGYGSLLRYANGLLTFHHNLYQHHDSRNPRLGDNIHLDFVNNVVYNWGGTAGYNAEDSDDNLNGTLLYFTNALNCVSNYFIAGPTTTGHQSVAFDSGVSNALQSQIYQSGNFIDSNKNGSLDGADTGWSMFGSPYTQLADRFPAPQVDSDTPQTAHERVLAFAGASVTRDEVDSRLLATVRNHTGRLVDAVGPNDQATDYATNNINGTDYVFVRGWPALNSATPPVDSDNDGIPNYFELAVGWSTSVANNNHTNSDGYTDLEWYLNWLAAPRALCNRNGSVDVNLRNIIGVTNNFTFGVSNGSNGAASLLGDGYTARFSAASNTNGLASFVFTATNSVTGNRFGPVAVGVLITTTNAPNTAPTLAAIPNTNVLAGATLTFTNTATDADIPAQTLTFSMLNPPSGANVNSNSGVFNWRPTIAQSGISNFMKVVVTDSGSPNLSVTQSFSALVIAPVAPQIQSPVFSNGIFNLIVNGDSGPDYIVQASTNLSGWSNIATNNSPVLPLIWNDNNASNFGQRFYRIQLGP